MGKHNGKARSSGPKVGSALVNSARKVGNSIAEHDALNLLPSVGSSTGFGNDCGMHMWQGGGRVGAVDEFRHTTDVKGAPNIF